MWHVPGSSLSDCMLMLMRFDTGWYKGIAEVGYPFHPDGNLFSEFFQSRYAFFPLFPLTLRLGMKLTGLGFYEWGAIWCSILSLGAFAMLYTLVADIRKSATAGFHTCLLLMFFPFSFSMSVILTEGMFLLLVVLAFWALHREKWVLLALAVLLIPLTRLNGMLMLPALALYMQAKYYGYRSLLEADFWRRRPFLQQPAFWILGFMLCSFAWWIAFQYGRTGLFFAFLEAQKGWGRAAGFSFDILFKTGEFSHQLNSFYAVGAMLLVIVGARRLPVAFTALCAMGILMPLSSGTPHGLTRYVLVYFPFFMTLQMGWAWLTQKLPKLPAIAATVALYLALLYFHYWALGHWIDASGFAI